MPKSKLVLKNKYSNKKKIQISKPVSLKSNLIKKETIEKKLPLATLETVVSEKKKRKPRTKNVSRMYFTDDTETAIIEYNNEIDVEKREKLFRERIYLPCQKLVENVFNTFKFSYFETGSQDVQRECLTHIVSNLHKFDPNRRSKTHPERKAMAYSYFSIVAKHFLILLNNTNYKKFNQNIEINDEKDEHTIQLQEYDKHYANQEMNDFMKLIIEFWDNNISKIFSKQRDFAIANAVVELLRKSENITLFNKKALYLYIREISGCKTQQITKVINKMKQFQTKMRKSYEDYGVIDDSFEFSNM